MKYTINRKYLRFHYISLLGELLEKTYDYIIEQFKTPVQFHMTKSMGIFKNQVQK